MKKILVTLPTDIVNLLDAELRQTRRRILRHTTHNHNELAIREMLSQ